MKRKKRKPEQPARSAPRKRKLSEIIQEYAGDFIRLGETPQGRQNYLNLACVGWNIGCAPPERRKKLVDQFMAEYLRSNPDANEEDLAGVRKDLEQLIDIKLTMFPADVRQIMAARYIEGKEEDSIEVASARL
jgi:hypothetical protein